MWFFSTRHRSEHNNKGFAGQLQLTPSTDLLNGSISLMVLITDTMNSNLNHCFTWTSTINDVIAALQSKGWNVQYRHFYTRFTLQHAYPFWVLAADMRYNTCGPFSAKPVIRIVFCPVEYAVEFNVGCCITGWLNKTFIWFYQPVKWCIYSLIRPLLSSGDSFGKWATFQQRGAD